MKYSKRDLHAVDTLALVLVGLGVFFGVITTIGFVQKVHFNSSFAIPAICFTSLGFALNFKLKEVMNNGGIERE